MENCNSNLCYYRKQVLSYKKEKYDASIVVVAYNRLDITKKCIESIIKYTNDVKYKLILVYNNSEHGEGILEYFNSVDYDDKVVVEIEKNNGAPYAYMESEKYFEGNYIIHLPNDIIVTSNWLSNLIKCAESDQKIGMVNPMSSNVSNLQCLNLDFDTIDNMQKKAGEYNKSNPVKWHERLRLITLATLFKRECLAAIGPIFDVGFIHDFGDDDVSFRVRRAGYKAVLACDTWIHHAHDVFHMENKNPAEYEKTLETGRKNFKDKYFGVDAWEDVNNYVFPYIENAVDKPKDVENVDILGVDTKCGTPILDIKNIIRKYNVFTPCLSAFSGDAKYVIDLNTICDKKVACDRYEYLNNCFENEQFDYIIVGNSINAYKNPVETAKKLIKLLKSGGQLFLNLKNTYSIMSLTNMMGYCIGTDENYEHISIETFCTELNKNGIDINLINFEQYQLDEQISNYISQVVNFAKSDDYDGNNLINRLTVDKYWVKITK